MTHAERKRLWQQHIEDWQASGLSGMAYCQQQSLTYCRFVYWRKKLTEPEASFPEQPVSSPGFAKVSAVPGPESSEGLTVSLPGGVSITGLHAGNVELLGAVLRLATVKTYKMCLEKFTPAPCAVVPLWHHSPWKHGSWPGYGYVPPQRPAGEPSTV